jgi:hypothetical protein
MSTAIDAENIPVNRGTDFVLSWNWKETDGTTNANLTGYAIQTMDVTPAIADDLSVEITTPATGLITARIEWNDDFVAGTSYYFRVQISSGGNDTSSNLFQVVYR